MKTAIEWLEEQMKTWGDLPRWMRDNIVEKAKTMEKEQIMNAFEAAEKDCGRDFLHGDLYYDETFKSEI